MALYDSTTGGVNVFDSFHRHQVIIANIRIPIMFRFTQNPNSLKFTLEKEFQETKTIGGYVYEMWGKKPQKLHGVVTIKKDNSWNRVLGINDKLTNFDLEDSTYNPEIMIFQTLFNIDQRRLAQLSGWAGTVSKVSSYVANPVSAVTGLVNKIKGGSVGTSQQYTKPDQTSLEGYNATMTDTVIYYKGNLYTGFFTRMSYAEDGKSPFVNVVDFDFLVTGTFLDFIDTQLTQTAAGRTIAALWGAGTSLFTGGSLISDLLKNTKSLIGM